MTIRELLELLEEHDLNTEIWARTSDGHPIDLKYLEWQEVVDESKTLPKTDDEICPTKNVLMLHGKLRNPYEILT